MHHYPTVYRMNGAVANSNGAKIANAANTVASVSNKEIGRILPSITSLDANGMPMNVLFAGADMSTAMRQALHVTQQSTKPSQQMTRGDILIITQFTYYFYLLL